MSSKKTKTKGKRSVENNSCGIIIKSIHIEQAFIYSAVHLICENIPHVSAGTKVTIDGYIYTVKNSTTLDTGLHISRYSELIILKTARGWCNLPDDLRCEYTYLDGITYSIVPHIMNEDSGCIPRQVSFVLSPADLNKFLEYKVRPGEDVLFKDEYNNLFIGTIANDMGTINVYLQNYANDAVSRHYSTLKEYIKKIHLIPKWKVPSQKQLKLAINNFPSLETDDFSIVEMKEHNFLYLDNGILKSTDPTSMESNVCLVYDVEHIYISEAFYGQIAYFDEKPYIVTNHNRILSLSPTYKAQGMVDTEYIGSQLHERFGTVMHRITIQDSIIKNITTGILPVMELDGLNRWIIEFPSDKTWTLARNIIYQRMNSKDSDKSNYYIPDVGDIVELSLKNKKVKCIIADDTHLLSILPANMLDISLDDFHWHYRVNDISNTTSCDVPVFIDSLTYPVEYALRKKLENVFGYCSLELCCNPHEDKHINVIGSLDISMIITRSDIIIPVYFITKSIPSHASYSYNSLRLNKTIEMKPVEDDVYKDNQSFIQACLRAHNLRSLPGDVSIRWVITYNEIDFSLPIERMTPHIYSISETPLEQGRYSESLGLVSLYDRILEKAQGEYIWEADKIVNPIKDFDVIFDIKKDYLPAPLRGKTIVLNGMMGKLTKISSYNSSNNTSHIDGLCFTVSLNDIMEIPANFPKSNYNNPKTFSRDVRQDCYNSLRISLLTIEHHTGINLLFKDTSLAATIKRFFAKKEEEIVFYKWKYVGNKTVLTQAVQSTKTPEKKNQKISLIINTKQGKEKNIKYSDLGDYSISILNEQDAIRITAHLLNRGVSYWINSETIMTSAIVGTSFAMGKVINMDGDIVTRDIVMEADVFPAIKTDCFNRMKIRVGDTVIIKAENNMRDYYTAITSNILLRNTSLGKAQLSTSFLMPDIAIGTTIPTYSENSPVAKLIDDYVLKMESPEKYALQQIIVSDPFKEIKLDKIPVYDVADTVNLLDKGISTKENSSQVSADNLTQYALQSAADHMVNNELVQTMENIDVLQNQIKLFSSSSSCEDTSSSPNTEGLNIDILSKEIANIKTQVLKEYSKLNNLQVELDGTITRIETLLHSATTLKEKLSNIININFV